MKQIRETLAFDDVLVVPTYSEVRSRLDTDLSTTVAGLKLKIPFISSPMSTVSEERMCIEIGKFGGLGLLHRFLDPEPQVEKLIEIHDAGVYAVPSVGVKKDERTRFKYLRMAVKLDAVLIDVANGHHILVKEMIDFIKQETHGELPIIAGNVATVEGYTFLAECGVNAVRTGIGCGKNCSTRIQTSSGVPLLQSLLDCQEAHQKYYPDVAVLADGGIRYPSDVVKSLVAGADAVICGSLFAGTKEAPGDIIKDNDGKAWKRYVGMASAAAQEEYKGGLKEGTTYEGVSSLVEYRGSLKRVLDDFTGGLRSGMSYVNARTLPELRQNAQFIRITNAGLLESHAPGTRK